MDKSSDNELQRLTYSDQKKRHFIRPMTICTADGRIVDMYGPYFATNNDATIIIDVLEKNPELTSLIKANDVFILDRGFRDCVQTLKQKYNYFVFLPTCKYYDYYYSYIFTYNYLIKTKGVNDNRPLTTIEANESRLCTKIRNVVECELLLF